MKLDSIQNRLTLIVTLGSLGFALIVGTIAFALEYRYEFRQARRLQDQLVATVQASAAVAAFAENPDIAKEVIDGLLMNPIIAGVRLESDLGFKLERQRVTPPPEQAVVYPLLSPINNHEKTGSLSVWHDEAKTHEQAISHALHNAALLMLQIIASAVVLMWLFRHMVTHPLADLAKSLESILPGTSQRLPVTPGNERNEIGRLINSSNTLLTAVEAAILEERRLQHEVDELDAHYRRIFDTTTVGIMILRPSGRLLNCNSTLMSRIVGLKFDANSTDNCRDFIDTIFWTPAEAWAMVQESFEKKEAVARDLRIHSGDNNEHWVHCIVSVTLDSEGKIEWIEGILYDITKRILRELSALRAAEHDLLTGLPNRRGIESRMEKLLKCSTESSQEFAVMLIDLDGFKAVNDTHGHAAGDQVLKVISQRIKGRCRSSRSDDLVARLGGDEFAFVLSDLRDHPSLVRQIARELLEMIALPIKLDNEVSAQVGGSIGIAIFPADGRTRDDLLAAADAAMYAVKHQGKNSFALTANSAEYGSCGSGGIRPTPKP